MLAVGQSVGQKNDYPKTPCDTAHSDFRCERIGGGTDEIMIYIAGRQILKAFRD